MSKKIHLLWLIPAAMSLLIAAAHPTWGFFAHRRINRLAVFTLPPDMMVFYKKHIDYITDHATDPDTRRYASAHEGPRHFMDLDQYGDAPFPGLPRTYIEAMMRFTEVWAVETSGDTVQVFGQSVIAVDSVRQNRKVDVFYTWKKTPPGLAVQQRALRIAEADYRDYFKDQVMKGVYADAYSLNPEEFASFFQKMGISYKPKAVYFKDKLSEHGVLPYNLQRMQSELTEAFRSKQVSRILKLSADYGHYIGDAHVPLHTCSNYNGQKTGQDGIHGFWESRIPELFADESYDYIVGKAEYIPYTRDWQWDMVLASHVMVDSVLMLEKKLRDAYPTDRQFCTELRNGNMIQAQCPEFAKAYEVALNGMIERRMRGAVHAVASAWYTAWVDAGQPDLTNLGEYIPDAAEIQEQEMLKNKFNEGKIIGRPEDH